MNAKNVIMELIKPLDIKINGSRAWDIHVLDERFYGRILAGGSLALGESYMEKWWTCDALDVFFEKILKARLNHKIKNKLYLIGTVIKAKLTNRQSIKRAFHIGKAHYDIGNELYAAMLDKRMMYSCGYWKNAKTLDKAQEAKLDLICKKAGLKKGMKVLDIGCGWGGFAKYAAQKYKVKVVGITVSKEQANHAKRNCSGLPIEIRLQDYRDLSEQFDRIISIGMFEHVGPKNYSAYMDVAHRCLKDDGIFILHTIGGNKSVTTTDLWIDRYIFPNAVLPSVKQIAEAAEGKFIMEDWHNFGPDYDKTLMQWHKNFVRAWQKLKKNYDDVFYRMWTYYLLSCAGTFRSRKNQLWQIVLSKNPKKEYVSVR